MTVFDSLDQRLVDTHYGQADRIHEPDAVANDYPTLVEHFSDFRCQSK